MLAMSIHSTECVVADCVFLICSLHISMHTLFSARFRCLRSMLARLQDFFAKLHESLTAQRTRLAALRLLAHVLNGQVRKPVPFLYIPSFSPFPLSLSFTNNIATSVLLPRHSFSVSRPHPCSCFHSCNLISLTHK